jgi:predicted NUDIX family NTP pyrophosphohydrolase
LRHGRAAHDHGDVAKESAGLMMFRRQDGRVEVLLAHPGGPFWRSRQQGAWTIPKGGVQDGESTLEAAIREFLEETGVASSEPYLPLGQVTQRSGKIVHAFAFEGTCDPAALVSMETTTEWPPRSGRHISIPEIDEIRFVSIGEARSLLNPAQVILLDRLIGLLDDRHA